MNTLEKEISEFNNNFRGQVPSEVIEVIDQATVNLKAKSMENSAMKTNSMAPKFSLVNQKNISTSLDEYLEEGIIVLNFYRGGWCPYCNMELNALQKMLPKIEKYGAKLLAISPEVPDHSLLTHEKNNLSFDILYDKGNKVANAFGLVFALPEELRPIYDSFNLNIPEYNGDDTFEIPMPATYIINQEGKIIYHFVDSDYTKRSEPLEVVEALRKVYSK